MDDIFIWTEALGCGEILTPMLNSYLHHMDYRINVIIYESDLEFLPYSPNIIPLIISDNTSKVEIKLSKTELIDAYKYGHNGTALLWSKLISERPERYYIHLDADTVFLGDVVSPILNKLSQGYGIVGTRRPYRHSAATKSKINQIIMYFRRDTVNTHCFGFDKKKIGIKQESLQKSINGEGKNRFHQRIFPVIDFFDRITFSISLKSKIFYLDSKNQSKHGKHNRDGTIESQMISFAAVGSGSAFYKNPNVVTSPTYKEFALASYSLYSQELLNQKIDFPPLDSPFLREKLDKLDKVTWSLR